MRFGVHVRMDKGLVKALDYAQELRCEAAQLFSGNPNGWARKPLDPGVAERFAARARELDIHPIVLHTPYLVNLAAPDREIWAKSRDALADAITRAPLMGASIIITHIGSHKGTGYSEGVSRIAEAVAVALEADPRPVVALELGSGSGNSIGSTFKEVADILRALDGAERVGIGIDTAHLYGSGYDISTEPGVRAMFEEMESLVGLDRLKVVHLNDTQMLLGSKRDRHYHIGEGNVGIEGFTAIVNYPGLDRIPGIIETPGRENGYDARNLGVLRSLRRSGGSEC